MVLIALLFSLILDNQETVQFLSSWDSSRIRILLLPFFTPTESPISDESGVIHLKEIKVNDFVDNRKGWHWEENSGCSCTRKGCARTNWNIDFCPRTMEEKSPTLMFWSLLTRGCWNGKITVSPRLGMSCWNVQTVVSSWATQHSMRLKKINDTRESSNPADEIYPRRKQFNLQCSKQENGDDWTFVDPLWIKK